MNHPTLSPHRRRFAATLFGALCLAGTAPAIGQTLRTATFDHDPHWEAVNNHITPTHVLSITQDFGYSPDTHVAGKDPGEIGGRITRAARPAYYADAVHKTLDDPLSASGTLAISHSSAGSGVFLGWFNSHQPGGGGRPMNSLGLDIDGEHAGARLAVRLITSSNKSAGTFITPFRKGFRPTPLRNDGTRYTWHLAYDPAANHNNGRVTFTIKSNSDHPDDWEGKPHTFDLPPGYKADNATLDRFGLLNLMKPGGTMTLHVDDLQYDGQSADFSHDPHWAASNNRATYQDSTQVGAHDFGYSPKTNFAGGAPGEIGGVLWRSEKNLARYADPVGPLSLDDPLQASGKVVLVSGAPDSDMYLGWFAADSDMYLGWFAADSDKDAAPSHAGNFLGVHVGGPTRVGHYFQPAYTTAHGTRPHVEAGPVLTPGKAYEWTLSYDPAANHNTGEIHLTLGTQSVTLPLKPAFRRDGARFDRFGLFTSGPGGQMVRLYLDDLQYTAAPTPPK